MWWLFYLQQKGGGGSNGNHSNGEALGGNTISGGSGRGVTRLGALGDGGKDGGEGRGNCSAESLLGLEELVVVLVQAEVDGASRAGGDHLAESEGAKESLVGASVIVAVVLGKGHLGTSGKLDEVLEHEEGNITGLSVTTAHAVGNKEELGLLDEAHGTTETNLGRATEGDEVVEAELELGGAGQSDGAGALHDAGAVVRLEGVLLAGHNGAVARIDVVETAGNTVTTRDDALVEREADQGGGDGSNQGGNERQTTDDIEAVRLDGKHSGEGDRHNN